MNLTWLSDVLQAIVDKAGLVGTCLVVLIVLFIVAATSRLLPKLSRRVFGTLAIVTVVSLFAIIVLVLVWPTIERHWMGVRTVDLILSTSDATVAPLEFRVRYRLPDRGVIETLGSRGVAELRGIPTGLNRLDVLNVEVGGWSMKESGPFPIVDGKITVAMMKTDRAAPIDGAKRPDPSAFEPLREELLKAPIVAPRRVTMHYRTSSVTPLMLTLHPYRPSSNSDPWSPNSHWVDLPLKNENQFYDEFTTGTGWFGLWIVDQQGRSWPLGAHNLFVAPQVWVIIDDNTGEDSDVRRYRCSVRTTEPS